ncbi:hypothetical protein BDC45DRAFT_532073 [Circinella umbellata]|nr:hypothetical protein BDC45DRAFT_532073 [Circinella umbellata]
MDKAPDYESGDRFCPTDILNLVYPIVTDIADIIIILVPRYVERCRIYTVRDVAIVTVYERVGFLQPCITGVNTIRLKVEIIIVRSKIYDIDVFVKDRNNDSFIRCYIFSCQVFKVNVYKSNFPLLYKKNDFSSAELNLRISGTLLAIDVIGAPQLYIVLFSESDDHSHLGSYNSWGDVVKATSSNNIDVSNGLNVIFRDTDGGAMTLKHVNATIIEFCHGKAHWPYSC